MAVKIEGELKGPTAGRHPADSRPTQGETRLLENFDVEDPSFFFRPQKSSARSQRLNHALLVPMTSGRAMAAVVVFMDKGTRQSSFGSFFLG